MLERITSLDDVNDWCVQQLVRGAADPKSAFHWPVLCTAGPAPHGRVVVLRKFDQAKKTITLYTDKRTQKVSDICANPRVECVFFDARKNVQMRVSGSARCMVDGFARDEALAALKPHRRSDYSTVQAPGSKRSEPDNNEIQTELDLANENFCLIEIDIHTIDWLKLDRAGHQRALLNWQTDPPSIQWSVP